MFGSRRNKKGSNGSYAKPLLTERQQIQMLMSMTAQEHRGDDSGDDHLNDAKKSKNKNQTSNVLPINRPKNKNGETFLHLATMKGDLEETKNLLKQGADVNCKDNAGWTPLHEACNHGHYRVAKVLLKAGANVNAQGLDGETPLHDASTNGHMKIALLLLKHGGDPHRKDDQGETPIDVAEQDDMIEVLTNFTKDMIADLKPVAGHSTELFTTNKNEHSSKFSNRKKRKISNIADFLDLAKNKEDSEDYSRKYEGKSYVETKRKGERDENKKKIHSSDSYQQHKLGEEFQDHKNLDVQNLPSTNYLKDGGFRKRQQLDKNKYKDQKKREVKENNSLTSYEVFKNVESHNLRKSIIEQKERPKKCSKGEDYTGNDCKSNYESDSDKSKNLSQQYKKAKKDRERKKERERRDSFDTSDNENKLSAKSYKERDIQIESYDKDKTKHRKKHKKKHKEYDEKIQMSDIKATSKEKLAKPLDDQKNIDIIPENYPKSAVIEKKKDIVDPFKSPKKKLLPNTNAQKIQSKVASKLDSGDDRNIKGNSCFDNDDSKYSKKEESDENQRKQQGLKHIGKKSSISEKNGVKSTLKESSKQDDKVLLIENKKEMQNSEEKQKTIDLNMKSRVRKRGVSLSRYKMFSDSDDESGKDEHFNKESKISITPETENNLKIISDKCLSQNNTSTLPSSQNNETFKSESKASHSKSNKNVIVLPKDKEHSFSDLQDFKFKTKANISSSKLTTELAEKTNDLKLVAKNSLLSLKPFVQLKDSQDFKIKSKCNLTNIKESVEMIDKFHGPKGRTKICLKVSDQSNEQLDLRMKGNNSESKSCNLIEKTADVNERKRSSHIQKILQSVEISHENSNSKNYSLSSPAVFQSFQSSVDARFQIDTIATDYIDSKANLFDSKVVNPRASSLAYSEEEKKSTSLSLKASSDLNEEAKSKLRGSESTLRAFLESIDIALDPTRYKSIEPPVTFVTDHQVKENPVNFGKEVESSKCTIGVKGSEKEKEESNAEDDNDHEKLMREILGTKEKLDANLKFIKDVQVTGISDSLPKKSELILDENKASSCKVETNIPDICRTTTTEVKLTHHEIHSKEMRKKKKKSSNEKLLSEDQELKNKDDTSIKNSKSEEELKHEDIKKSKCSEVPLDVSNVVENQLDMKFKKKTKEKVKQKLSMSECVQERLERENVNAVKQVIDDQPVKDCDIEDQKSPQLFTSSNIGTEIFKNKSDTPISKLHPIYGKGEIDFDKKKMKVEKSMNMQIDKILKSSAKGLNPQLVYREIPKNLKVEVHLHEESNKKTKDLKKSMPIKVHSTNILNENVSRIKVKATDDHETSTNQENLTTKKEMYLDGFLANNTKGKQRFKELSVAESKSEDLKKSKDHNAKTQELVQLYQSHKKSFSEDHFWKNAIDKFNPLLLENKEKIIESKTEKCKRNESLMKEPKLDKLEAKKEKNKHSKKHKRSNSSEKIEKAERDLTSKQKRPKRSSDSSDDNKNIQENEISELLNSADNLSNENTYLEYRDDFSNCDTCTNEIYDNIVPFAGMFSKDPLNLEGSDKDTDDLISKSHEFENSPLIGSIDNSQQSSSFGPGPITKVTIHEHILYCGPKTERQKPKEGLDKLHSDLMKRKVRRSSESENESKIKLKKLCGSSDQKIVDTDKKELSISHQIKVNILRQKSSLEEDKLSSKTKDVLNEKKHAKDSNISVLGVKKIEGNTKNDIDLIHSEKESRYPSKVSKPMDETAEKKENSTAKVKVKEFDLSLNMGVNENILKEFEHGKKRKRKRISDSKENEIKMAKFKNLSQSEGATHLKLKKSLSNGSLSSSGMSDSQSTFFNKLSKRDVSLNDTSHSDPTDTADSILGSTEIQNLESSIEAEVSEETKLKNTVHFNKASPYVDSKNSKSKVDTLCLVKDRSSIESSNTSNLSTEETSINEKSTILSNESDNVISMFPINDKNENDNEELKNKEVKSMEDRYSLENENAVTNLLSIEEDTQDNSFTHFAHINFNNNNQFGNASFNFSTTDFLTSQNSIQHDYSTFNFDQANLKIDTKNIISVENANVPQIEGSNYKESTMIKSLIPDQLNVGHNDQNDQNTILSTLKTNSEKFVESFVEVSGKVYSAIKNKKTMQQEERLATLESNEKNSEYKKKKKKKKFQLA